MVALEIHERIQMLKNNLVPENKLEYLGIDKEIKALIEEKRAYKTKPRPSYTT